MASPLEIARALAPRIRARSDEIEAARQLPKDLVLEIADAGLFKVAVSKADGGLGADIVTTLRVIEEVARADGSTGWCVAMGINTFPQSAQLGAEVRRAVTRALRRRIAELDTSAFENLCAALLDKMGMRDVRVAKRSKEGPLYLARQRRGVSDLRVAVKLVRGGREIGRADVQELRKDLAHYSAQMGLVLAPGEAGRDARSEASAAGQAPVALYAGEALPEEMIACRVGVTVQTVEVPDVDEAFFAGLLRHREERLEARVRPEMEGRGGERRHDRDERPQEEQPPEVTSDSLAPVPEAAAEPEPAELPEPEPSEAHEAEAGAPVPAGEPASPPVEGGESREVRRRRGREDRPRATNAAEQAWGQPAGTMKFAPPPGPTVVAQTTSREESPKAEPGESAEEPERPPQDPKPDSF